MKESKCCESHIALVLFLECEIILSGAIRLCEFSYSNWKKDILT